MYYINFHCLNFFRYFYELFDISYKSALSNILIASTISMIPLMQSQIEFFISVLLTVLLVLVLFNQNGSLILILSHFLPLLSFLCIGKFSIGGEFLPYLILSTSCSLIIAWSGVKLYTSEVLC